MGEFELIERFFKRPARQADLGVGDDCALLSPRPGHQLALSADALVEGQHFLSTVSPERLGHKCLAVNLSDLAACGAQPRAFLLSLTLPRADADWLQAFAQGLFALADAHGCELVGGDTTQSPLNIGITVIGDVPTGQALLRSGARVGDDVYVSGQLGDARLALEAFRGRLSLPEAVFNWGWRCAASPMRPSTSATACWATWGTSCNARAWVPRYRPPGPKAARPSAPTCLHCPRHADSTWRWPVATTTNSSSRPPRPCASASMPPVTTVAWPSPASAKSPSNPACDYSTCKVSPCCAALPRSTTLPEA